MGRSRQEYSAGFTLLELTLSTALGVALLGAFFVGFQGLMQAIRLVADETRGSAQVSEVLDTMAREIDQASVLNTVNDFDIDFMVGTLNVKYRLVASAPTASGDAWIERQQDGGNWVRIGPRGVLANLHPFQGVIKTANNTDVGGYNPVPFFVSISSVAGPGPAGHTLQLTTHAVVQPNLEAPVRYVRAVSTPRILN